MYGGRGSCAGLLGQLGLRLRDALPTIYRASNPAASANLADMPSYTPGAVMKALGSCSDCRRVVAADGRAIVDVDVNEIAINWGFWRCEYYSYGLVFESELSRFSPGR